MLFSIGLCPHWLECLLEKVCFMEMGNIQLVFYDNFLIINVFDETKYPLQYGTCESATPVV